MAIPHLVCIRLGASFNDPTIQNPTYQASLREFCRFFEIAEIHFSRTYMTFNYSGLPSYETGQYFIPTAHFSEPVISDALVAWLTSRPGRTFTLVIGTTDFTAGCPDDMGALLASGKHLIDQLIQANKPL